MYSGTLPSSLSLVLSSDLDEEATREIEMGGGMLGLPPLEARKEAYWLVVDRLRWCRPVCLSAMVVAVVAEKAKERRLC